MISKTLTLLYAKKPLNNTYHLQWLNEAESTQKVRCVSQRSKLKETWNSASSPGLTRICNRAFQGEKAQI